MLKNELNLSFITCLVERNKKKKKEEGKGKGDGGVENERK